MKRYVKSIRLLIVESAIKNIVENKNFSRDHLEQVINENLSFPVRINELREEYGYQKCNVSFSDELGESHTLQLTVKH